MLEDYARSYFKEEVQVTPLTGDAGNRAYYKLALPDQSTFVLCKYVQGEEESFKNFVYISALLQKNHIHSPEVLLYDTKNKLMIIDDLGSTDLEADFKKTQSLAGHKKTLDSLLKLQSVEDRLALRFTKEKFLWELNFAKKYLSEVFKLNTLDDESLDQEFDEISHILTSQNVEVLTHRDFHSRNIMIYQNETFMIDYQDARMGNIFYDLTSLIEDTYVDLSEDQKKELIDYYLDKSGYDSDERFYFLYHLQALQRSIKAAGSFAFLKIEKNKDRYLQYLKPSFKNIFVYLEKLNDFNAIKDLIKKCDEANLK